MMKAEEAAKAVEGAVVAPKFTAEEKAKGLTDFNDLAVERGLQSLAGDLKPPAPAKETEKKPRRFDTLALFDGPLSANRTFLFTDTGSQAWLYFIMWPLRRI